MNRVEPTGLDPFIRRMGRTFRPRCRLARGLPDAVPLVDLALLVVLFMIAASSFVLQPGIVVDLPEAPFAAGTRFGGMVVTIAQEGLIFFNDERIPLSGLTAAFRQAVHRHPEATLLIEADRRVPQATLVKVYDMARDAGVDEVVLATQRVPGKQVGP